MLAELREGSLDVFHLEAEMFDADFTASTLSLRMTFKSGEVDVTIGQKNTVDPQADLFETEHLLVKSGCFFWICRPDIGLSRHSLMSCLACTGFKTRLAEGECPRSDQWQYAEFFDFQHELQPLLQTHHLRRKYRLA